MDSMESMESMESMSAHVGPCRPNQPLWDSLSTPLGLPINPFLDSQSIPFWNPYQSLVATWSNLKQLPKTLFLVFYEGFKLFSIIFENTIFSSFLNHHLGFILTSFWHHFAIKKLTFSLLFSVFFVDFSWRFWSTFGSIWGSILVDLGVDFGQLFGRPWGSPGNPNWLWLWL